MKPSSESLKLRGKVGSRKWPSVFHSARTFSPVLLQFPALPDKHQPYNRSHTSACGLPVLHSAGIILPEIKLCTAVICFSLSTSSYSIPSSEPIRSSVPPVGTGRAQYLTSALSGVSHARGYAGWLPQCAWTDPTPVDDPTL